MSNISITPSKFFNGRTDFTRLYSCSRSDINKLAEFLLKDDFLDNIKLLFTNPIENVVSLKLYPFDIPKFLGIEHERDDIIVGGVNSEINATKLSADLTVPIKQVSYSTIPPIYNSFLDYSPHTKIEVFLPYVGFIELENALVINKTIYIEYVIDFISGKCVVMLSNDEGIFLTRDCNIGVDIPLGGNVLNEVSKNILQAGITSIGIVSAGAIPALGYGISNSIQSGQQKVFKGGSVGTLVEFYKPQNPYFIITSPIVNEPNNYAKTVGKPLNEYRILKNLSGYTVVGDIHIEGLSTATSEEISEVDRLLKSGVILPDEQPVMNTLTIINRLTGVSATYSSPFSTIGEFIESGSKDAVEFYIEDDGYVWYRLWALVKDDIDFVYVNSDYPMNSTVYSIAKETETVSQGTYSLPSVINLNSIVKFHDGLLFTSNSEEFIGIATAKYTSNSADRLKIDFVRRGGERIEVYDSANNGWTDDEYRIVHVDKVQYVSANIYKLLTT